MNIKTTIATLAALTILSPGIAQSAQLSTNSNNVLNPTHQSSVNSNNELLIANRRGHHHRGHHPKKKVVCFNNVCTLIKK